MLGDIIVFFILIVAFCCVQCFSCVMEARSMSEGYSDSDEEEDIAVANARPMTPRTSALHPVKIILNNDNIVN